MSDFEPAGQEEIAIIGMACRFPGARNLDEFWRNLRDGVETISFFSEQELSASGADPAMIRDPHHVPAGPILDEVDSFDAGFFDFSPRQAELTDPQHRVFMECAWEALESAGYDPAAFDGSIGVFGGSSMSSYMLFNLYPALGYTGVVANLQTLIGNDKDYLATHTSYKLNLKGPSVSVQTACSTSLVAVHLACQSLLDQECDMALAGGVTVRVPQRSGYLYQEGGILSPDGHCRPFDARAQGTLFGSGAGIVVLKRLSDALADGDRIEAIIKGSAINNDGSLKVGYTAPGEDGQAAVVAEALALAQVKPETIGYVEAHGTGTPLGDPIEIAALTRVFRASTDARGFCAIGAVKSNFGHLESAAGIAGLIKTVLALKQRQIPPSLNFETPNPAIDFASSPFYVNAGLAEWKAGRGPRRAGVSSFGIGGTNAHVVLEEAPQPVPSAVPAPGGAYLLPLSARGPAALHALAGAYRDFLRDGAGGAALPDICYTASMRRRHHDQRLAVVGHTPAELAERLDAALQSEAEASGAARGQGASARPRVVFVFPGQGSQWLGMGRQLLEQLPVFRAALEQCERAMRPYVDWSLLKELSADEAQSRMTTIDVIQPVLFAIQVGLAALWRAWGVAPDAVIGHSMGEVAAAHVAGALSLEDAAQIICQRSKLLRRVSGQGAMAVVGLSLDQTRAALAGYEDRLSVAVSNSPQSTVVSGDPAGLKELIDGLEQQGTFCRWVKVDVASHSPQMDPLRAELLAILQRVRPRRASVTMVSTVLGQAVEGPELSAPYWVRNLREPVLLAPVVQRLRESGHDVFVEISAHPVLLPAIEDCLYHLGQPGAVIPSLRRESEERAALLESLGALYRLGQPVDWARFYPEGGRCVPLPSYQWQRQRFWLEPGKGARLGVAGGLGAGAAGQTGHPLLGRRLRSALKDIQFESLLSLDALPYLADHQVCGRVVFPATAYLELIWAAIGAAYGAGPRALADVALNEPLFLAPDEPQTVQVILSPAGPGGASIQLFSQGDDEETWRLHATGSARLGPAPGGSPVSLAEARERCQEELAGETYYERLWERGLEYGPRFRGIETLWRRDGEALAIVRLPEPLGLEAPAYSIHPALLDACFQVFGATFAREGERSVYLPIGVEAFRVHAAPPDRVWSYTALRAGDKANPEAPVGDVYLFDEEGRLLAEVVGLVARRTTRAALERTTQDRLSEWLYKLRWEPKARAHGAQQRQASQAGRWLIFADRRGAGEELARLLEQRGASCALIFAGEAFERSEHSCYSVDPARPDDFERLLAADPAPCRGIVHLWGLDAAPAEQTGLAALWADQARMCGSALHLVQAVTKIGWPAAPRLWLVTQGAQPAGAEPAPLASPATLWGLGRVIALEHPDLHCVRVDLDPAGALESLPDLLEEIVSRDEEDQVAFRRGARLVPRLVHSSAADRAAEAGLQIPENQPFRLAIPQRGVFDNLVLERVSRRSPGPGEVEIRVAATGLNFRDVLFATGLSFKDVMNEVNLYPGETGTLGLECAGTVVAVGEGVRDLRVGDEVVAFAAGTFRSFVTVPADFVARKPGALDFEEAATIPVTFLTAYYSLRQIARLAAGERVLIHAAAGGVGIAAVQLAQQAGAEVFATASSPEKQAFLRSLGVEHIMNSRTLDFADQIMEYTGGRGVDVVLNSLAGDFVARSLSVLSPGGRFVEIGKLSIWELDKVAALRPDISYVVFDLAQEGVDHPAEVGGHLRALMDDFAAGALRPLPRRVFPIQESVAAFRTMAQARHIGKIVVTQAQRLPGAAFDGFQADASYLITGGLGDLGLLVARWMVEQGARHLALIGRGGASEAASAAVAELEQAGARVLVLRADVSQEAQVARVLAEIEQDMPPLRGVVHAAGLLDDGVLLRQDWARFERVFAPKVAGAWNLHAQTRNLPLDFFVLFSSTASLLGSPGQGSYAAANAFMDALAHERRAQGLPALSINWGGWSEIGLAARHNVGDRMIMQGIGAIAPQQGLRALEQVMHQSAAQVAVLPVNWSKLLEQFAVGGEPPVLAELVREARSRVKGQQSAGDRPELLRRLEEAPPHNRRRLLMMHMRDQIGKVLGLDPSFAIDPQQPLNQLGLDSLMAIELRNALGMALGRALPATLLFDYPTLDGLAGYLAREVLQLPTGDDEPGAAPEDKRAAEQDQALADIQQLSADEVEAMLAEELEALRSLVDGD